MKERETERERRPRRGNVEQEQKKPNKKPKKNKKNLSVKNRIMMVIVLLGIISLISGAVSIFNLNRVQKISNHVNDVSIRNMIDFDEIIGTTHRIQKNIYHIGYNANEAEIKALEEGIVESEENMTFYAEEALGNATEDKKELTTKLSSDIKILYKNAYASIEAVKANDRVKYNDYIIKNIEVSDNIENAIGELIGANDEDIKKVLKDQLAILTQAIIIAIVLATATGLLMALGMMNIRSYIVIPLSKLENKLNELIAGIENRKGDLSARVDVKCNDEIGKVAKNINKFIETLEGIILNLTGSTQEMYGVIGNVIGKVGTADNSVSDISALMEELAASMEEVTATVESVSNETDQVNNEVTDMSKDTTNLLEYTQTMKARAEEMNKSALETKQGTGQVVSGIVEKLDNAIENSKSISQINDLTQDILAISEQTNLLSLNASIEAARAGEAGRGFAVVAGQIRQLADSSKDAASNIQQLNSEIVSTVQQLIGNSKDMINYINETILKDYDHFVEMGMKYDQDASHINATMKDFDYKNKNLTRVMEMIKHKMSGIASTMEESSGGVMSAATNVSELVEGINDIHVNMDKNEIIAKTLKNQTDGFTLNKN